MLCIVRDRRARRARGSARDDRRARVGVRQRNRCTGPRHDSAGRDHARRRAIRWPRRVSFSRRGCSGSTRRSSAAIAASRPARMLLHKGTELGRRARRIARRQGHRAHRDDSRRILARADRAAARRRSSATPLDSVDAAVARHGAAAPARRSDADARGISLPRHVHLPRWNDGARRGRRDGEAIRADLETGVDGAARHAPSVAQRRDGAGVDRRDGSAACRRSDR